MFKVEYDKNHGENKEITVFVQVRVCRMKSEFLYVGSYFLGSSWMPPGVAVDWFVQGIFLLFLHFSGFRLVPTKSRY
jgi:hypothetical protein